jgi:hypothetical protein
MEMTALLSVAAVVWRAASTSSGRVGATVEV